MNKDFQQGNIVKIKPEWYDSPEDEKFRYVILEQTGDDRYLIRLLDSEFALAPTTVVSGNMIQLADI